MHSHQWTARFGALLLVVAACGGSGGTSATDGSTTDDTTMNTTVEPTSTTTVDPTTTTSDGPTSTGDTGGTDSDSATGTSTGTTTGDTDATGTTAPVETTTGETTTGDTTGSDTTGETGGVVEGLFQACPGGDADVCPASDPLCVVEDGPGGFGPNGSFFVQWSFCTRECASDDDCASGLDGGKAKARCVEAGNNMVKVCVLDCGFGQACPDAVVCSDWNHCGTHHCDCQGDGCNDPLCAP